MKYSIDIMSKIVVSLHYNSISPCQGVMTLTVLDMSKEPDALIGYRVFCFLVSSGQSELNRLLNLTTIGYPSALISLIREDGIRWNEKRPEEKAELTTRKTEVFPLAWGAIAISSDNVIRNIETVGEKNGVLRDPGRSLFGFLSSSPKGSMFCYCYIYHIMMGLKYNSLIFS